MKKLIFLLAALFAVITSSFAQTQTRVTLKSGAVVTGALVSFNPASHIILNVGGCDTTIDMKDVLSVEDNNPANKPLQSANVEVAASQGSEAQDSVPEYPDSFIMRVGPYDIEMVLIRGGKFAMGYDGRGSMNMNSEPVHDVNLSDFYVNKEPITKDVVRYLEKGDIEYSGVKHYRPFSWKNANRVSELLAIETGLPIQLISEAQWEYLATGNDAHSLIVDNNEYNYCLDYRADYVKSSRPIVDPTGPISGSIHVKRSFRDPILMFSRNFNERIIDTPAVRITFPATAFDYAMLAKNRQ